VTVTSWQAAWCSTVRQWRQDQLAAVPAACMLLRLKPAAAAPQPCRTPPAALSSSYAPCPATPAVPYIHAGTQEFAAELRRDFGKVAWHRPKATRSESKEVFLLGLKRK